MKIENWPRIFSWPMYSSSARGRSVRSTTTSCGLEGAAAMRRSVSIILELCLGQQLQGLPYAIAHRNAFGQLLHRVRGFLVAVAEREQRVQNVRGDRRRAVHAHRRGHVRAELVLELEQQTLRGFLADAGYAGELSRLLHRDRLCEFRNRQPGQYRQRGAGADAADPDELPERPALVLGTKAEQQMRVLAHDEMCEQNDLVSQIGEIVEGAHRDIDLVGHPLHVEQDLRRILLDERA